jgi:uncharacterized protein
MPTDRVAVEALAEELDGLRPIDHHCHGVVSADLDRMAFEDLTNEGFESPPPGTSHLDSPVGLAIRRWCAPLLDLEPFVEPEVYVERRVALGADEVNRRLLSAARLSGLIVETGYRASDIVGPSAMAQLAGAPTFEVVRLETVAEEVGATDPSASGYADAFREHLHVRAASAVGLKTILAYRGGFDIDPSPPDDGAVAEAAGRWFRAPEPRRLADPVLLRFGIWAGADLARDRGLPLQIHAGWGDPDITLHLTNPSLLTDLAKSFAGLGVDVVFLHCYPYHREAAYLATVLPNVYFDVGEAITYLGTRSRGLLAEAIELAPFTKQLYSSDAFGVAELYVLGATHFRRGLARILGGWVDAGDCSLDEARRIAHLIGVGNASRLYPLERRDR